jgi:hypothetical protein
MWLQGMTDNARTNERPQGMEKTDSLEVTPASLLTWHEKVRSVDFPFSRECEEDLTLIGLELLQLTEVAGVGSIVRVMTDRRMI